MIKDFQVYLPNDYDKVKSGYYYYHPITHTLCPANHLFSNAILRKQTEYPELQFIVYWPAIKPLYKDISKNLVYKEAGHICSLLFKILNREKIAYRLEILDKELNQDNSLVARIIFSHGVKKVPRFNLKINLLTNETTSFEDQNRQPYLKHYQSNILFRTTEISQFLYNGQFLVILEGDPTIKNLFFSGIIFQKMSEILYQDNIGSCMLGIQPYPSSIYAMIIGKIDDSEKYIKAESQVKKLPIKDIINKELEKFLPQYMLPYEYKILAKLPISPNGKVDLSKLPVVELKKYNTYTPPQNSFEVKLCRIWAQILGLHHQEVGTKESFFRLGGNSLLAMQTVKVMNQELEINFSIKDLYELNSISKISKKFNSITLAKRHKRVI